MSFGWKYDQYSTAFAWSCKRTKPRVIFDDFRGNRVLNSKKKYIYIYYFFSCYKSITNHYTPVCTRTLLFITDLFGGSATSLFLRPILGTDFEAFKKNSSPANPRRMIFGYGLPFFITTSLGTSCWSLRSNRDVGCCLSTKSVNQMLFRKFVAAYSLADIARSVCKHTKPIQERKKNGETRSDSRYRSVDNTKRCTRVHNIRAQCSGKKADDVVARERLVEQRAIVTFRVYECIFRLIRF